MHSGRLGLCLFFTACSNEPAVVGPCEAIPSGRVELPADESAHADAQSEWWYWVGHLESNDRHFGFEQVFFRTRISDDAVLTSSHFAITDINELTHQYTVDYGEELSPPVTSGFDFQMRDFRAFGGDGHDTLHGEVDNFTLDVTLEATKAPVLQHDDGYTDYPFGGFTYYYSRERMAIDGVLRVGDDTLQVTGTGWFDHQWGDLAQVVSAGWDWFAIQLDDEREIMLFLAHQDDGLLLVGGSLNNADCDVRTLTDDEVSLTSLGEWTSPRTACTYPIGWEITVDDLTLTVTPVLEGQEVHSMAPTYWEGACVVSGDATGRAYVELNGYCD